MKWCNADVVLDHEIAQTLTINQYHLLMHFFRILDGGALESTRCDENTFLRFLSCECTDKTLNFFSSNCVLPAFRLHVNHIQTKPILIDNSIDSLIARHFCYASSLFF